MIQGVRYNIRTLLGVYLNDCLPNNLWSNFDMGLHEIPTAFIALTFHFLRWNGGISPLHFLRWDSTFQGDIPLFKVGFHFLGWDITF